MPIMADTSYIRASASPRYRARRLASRAKGSWMPRPRFDQRRGDRVPALKRPRARPRHLDGAPLPRRAAH